MTKGQIEFLVAVGVIVIGFGVVGFEFKAYHDAPQPAKPISQPIVLPNGQRPTSTPSPTSVHCDVLTTIHANMTQQTVQKLCGAPDIIDSTSDEVKNIEKIFKGDEIWYYIASKATVEITDGFVTKVAPMALTQDPLPLNPQTPPK